MQEIVVLKRKLKDKENNSRKTIIFLFSKIIFINAKVS